MANGRPGGDFPPWLDKTLKGGGIATALVLFWLLFAQPMRDDFKSTKADVFQRVDKAAEDFGKKIDRVASELSAIRELISNDLRQRITRNEQRDIEVMHRLDKIEAALERDNK